MKNRFVTLFFTLIIFITLIGCSNSNNISQSSSINSSTSPNVEKTLGIITSFYPMYIHTINVCKDIKNVTVTNMTKPQTGCLHDYSITTEDMKKLETGQIFIVNGLGMESFMDKVIKQLPNLKIIEASGGIDLIKDDSGESEYNPHVWVSISNAIIQVNNITKQLSAIDPSNKDKYTANADIYTKKLESQRAKMHAALDGLPNRNIVTFHEAFPYFAKEFSLNINAVVEHEPGTDPSPKELVQTINTIKQSQTKAIFAEPQYPAKSAQMIAKETGLTVYSLDPAVSGEANGDYDAYLKIMDENLKVLEEALK